MVLILEMLKVLELAQPDQNVKFAYAESESLEKLVIPESLGSNAVALEPRFLTFFLCWKERKLRSFFEKRRIFHVLTR